MGVLSQRNCSPYYTDLVTYALRHNNYDADKPILIDALDPSLRLSRKDVTDYVKLLIDGFRAQGVRKGDTVCLHMFNHIWYPVIFYAVVGVGAQFTASNPAYTVTELASHLRTSESRWVITESSHSKSVQTAMSENGIDADHMFLRTDDELSPDNLGFRTLQQIMYDLPERYFDGGEVKPHGPNWVTFNDQLLSQTKVAVLNTTSGTTGLPKMAARSHHSLVIENEAIEDSANKPYEINRLLSVPFFHAFAAPLAVTNVLRFGHTTYVMRKYVQSQYLDAIERFNITETAMAPPLIIRFLAMPPADREKLSTIQQVWSGGAPLSIGVQDEALRMFAPGARISQVYGMTEAGWMTTFHYPESDHTGSVGRLLPTYEAKLMDEEENDVTGCGARGELLVRGPMTMLGYYRNAEATLGTFTRDGWLKTGDVACISDDGKIYIVDRKKELIKVRGWQVSPAELEGRMLSHPEIVDAAAIGVPHPSDASEIPRAYVVRRHGSVLSGADIKTYLLQSLARYKVTDCEIRFCDSIPKSASGKILKKDLRNMAVQEVVA